ncbi:rab9 effector protein with kelch motifs isoform X2 [Labrus mixtus]|uniref:rab9 effector protein with kelch motifs isoform X2 n=1 Tax=Labrus mixtus TaxID=508554 RepID=UPI0029C03828|nr:rab9 effector protein with kelch motifs isoform X2 [Labrus mixtus]
MSSASIKRNNNTWSIHSSLTVMEFLPVLDPLDKPKAGIWYSLMPRGSAPGVSVGHTCTFIPSADEGKGSILIVGGANPSGSFAHSNIINLDNHEWDIPEWEGLDSRYEHCCFVPESCPQSLWVFGGAQQSGNRNCIQNVQLTDSGSSWKSVSVNGKPPSPRTYHTSSACLGERLYVFSGGEAGAAPVADPALHVFDTASSAWSQPETQGRQPPARHGHVIVAAGSKIYIHGGMAGDKFHNDMFSLDTKIMKWEKVQVKGDIPPGVAAHSAVALGKNIYISGGMTAEGASNSMYRFNTDKSRWVLMKFEGDMPPDRLDHSMCLLPWTVHAEGNGDKEQADSPTASETIHLAFVFGGMDTQGVIHNDCVVTVVS